MMALKLLSSIPIGGALMTSLYLSVTCTTDVMYDFEKKAEFSRWSSYRDQNFYRVQALHVLAEPGRPLGDTTRRDKYGHFIYASYNQDDPKQDISVITYHCQQPTGANCRLIFNAIIHSPFDLVIATRPRCSLCVTSLDVTSNESSILHVNNTLLDEGWQRKEVHLGVHNTTFDIEFYVTLPKPQDFVAIDDVQFMNCQPDSPPELPVTCPAGQTFLSCQDYQSCDLSHDQHCETGQDCWCLEDEMDCDILDRQPQASLQLEKCNFESAECPWYNVDQADCHNNNTSWQVANNTGDNLQPRPQVKMTNAGVLLDKHLVLDLSHFSPTHVATLRSVMFQAQLSGYGQCQVRFWFRRTNPTYRLQLELVQISNHTESGQSVTSLWSSSGHVDSKTDSNSDSNTDSNTDSSSQSQKVHWKKVEVHLSSKLINSSYVLQFKVSGSEAEAKQSLRGEVGLYGINLSADCFHPAVSLMSCGATGTTGPSQEQCDRYYHPNQVKVQQDGDLAGVQVWTVPRTMTYRIEAGGGRGGLLGDMTEKDELRATQATQVKAKFVLHKGEQLYFLIGQNGESCLGAPDQQLDSRDYFPWQQLTNSSHVVEARDTRAGGGGGATVVFKKTDRDDVQVLMVAGGGLGNHHPPDSPGLAGTDQTPIISETMGRNVSMMSPKEAETLVKGSLQGSSVCSMQIKSCRGHGGFGAGGAACIGVGGYGGGATELETQTSRTRGSTPPSHRLYVHQSALSYSRFTLDIDDPDLESGFVHVYPADNCGCDNFCLWLDFGFTSPTCLCSKANTTTNASYCVDSQDSQETQNFIIIIVSLVVVTTFLIAASICLYIQRRTFRNRQPTNIKKLASILCPCVNFSRRTISLSAHVLPQIQRPPAVMHVNPNYDVVHMKCPEQGLKNLNRKHLKLVSALGQGAFGEVYYGLLSNMALVDGDMAVAVKTLPQMCTEQTEMDFLMEAVIVSKFNHPNIVKFIGVCFEQHPHYLVLELLEGGDLKGFLRQARPKWDQPSLLTVLDLLRLCLDVARGCEHLEGKHFIHRDIAARNCLLTTKGPNRTAKIADFGMARDIYRSDYYKKAGKAMLPVKWMPPEAFLDGLFTSKTDVWSFGILMWEVFSLGHVPYPGCSNEEVMNLVTLGGRLEPPDSCPSPVFDIMSSCWSTLPEGRPNFSLIIASLERTLQDDDMVTRGLPVFYVPPIINTRGLRLQDTSISRSPQPRSTTRLVSPSSNQTSTRMPHISGDGYLEPLLTPLGHDSHDRSLHSANALNMGSRSSPNSLSHAFGPRVVVETAKSTNKPICRTPRVFYKPGCNLGHSINSSSDLAATEVLLPSQTSQTGPTSQHREDGDLKEELCVDLSRTGLESSGDDCHTEQEGEEFKSRGATAASVDDRKTSYTHFPKPSS